MHQTFRAVFNCRQKSCQGMTVVAVILFSLVKSNHNLINDFSRDASVNKIADS